MKKFFKNLTVALLCYAGLVYAATAGNPITVPSSGSAGYFLVSTTTGAYIATTTDPAHFGSVFATSTATSTYAGGIKAANFCLTDGSCLVSGSEVTGSGTTNGLAYWTSASAIGSTFNPSFNSFSATSTTATSTISGNLSIKGNLESLVGSVSYALGGMKALFYTATSTSIASIFPYASTTAISSSGGAWFATSGGNVGIGTTSPGAKLTVTGDSPIIRLEGVGSNAAERSWQVAADPQNYGSFGIQQSTAKGGTTFTTRFIMDENLNVGILDTSPDATLEVNKNGSYDLFALTNSSDGDLFIVKNGGNVGIGTVSPIDMLHLASGSNIAFVMSRANGTFPFEIFRDASGGAETLRAQLSDGSTWHNYITMGEGNSTHFTSNMDLQAQGGRVNIGNVNTNGTAVLDISIGSAATAKTTDFTTANISNTATSTTASVVKTGLQIASTGTWSGAGSTNYGIYVSSVTGGTTNYDAIFNGGGNVGIGTTTPWRGLSVAGTMGVSSSLTDAAGTPGSLCYNTSTFEVTKNNALTCTVSDRDQKRDIERLTVSGSSATDLLMKLRPVSFEYKDNPDRSRWGFIAQDVQEIDPRLGDAYDEEGVARSIDLPAISAITVKAVQELIQENKAQQKQIDQLKKQIKLLNDR